MPIASRICAPPAKGAEPACPIGVGMAHFTRLDTERLTLRRFAETDLAALYAYRSDPEIARFQPWQAHDLEAARGWLANVLDGEPGSPGRWFQFALVLRGTGALVGDLGLRTEADPRQMEIGFTLSRAAWGRGYATEAVRAVLGIAFGLGAHRVIGNCDARNLASVRLMERVGMRREAHHVEDWWVGDEWTSSFVYAALEREWPTPIGADR